MANYKRDETTSWDAGRVRGGTGEVRRSEPSPRRRRRRRLGGVQYLLFVLIVSAVLAGIGWLLLNDLCAFNRDPATATVEVTSDDTVGSIAAKLKEANLIEYKWFFQLFADMSHAKEKIGVGSYELNSDMDYRALITSMRNSSGNLNADTVKVTIPEGYTVSQIITLLASKGVNTEDALTEAAKSGTFSYDYIESTGEISRLEGFLFPDTYEFYINEKAPNALNRLIHNFDNKMTDDRLAEVKASGYSLKQIVTIASLIEKETDGTDQRNIASVIYNRLKDSGSHGTYKKLNIDASLLYALPDHEGAITKKDMQVDSPYNLYTNAGLPPTPIANPGLTAIDAALEPAQTDYYYYALGKDGVHHFFTNYDDHLKFVNSDEYATQTK